MLAGSLSAGVPAAPAGAVPPAFQQGKQVWLEGREREVNLFVGSDAKFGALPGQAVKLRITAHPVYRAYLNGKFCEYGPARGPHGYSRVDEYDLSSKVRAGENSLTVEVAGYNANSYYLTNEPSMLQAEILVDGQVVASTGDGQAFGARVLPHRLQRVQRTSFQRLFSEVYRLDAAARTWIEGNATREAGAPPTETTSPRKLLGRGVPLPRFSVKQPLEVTGAGSLRYQPPAQYWSDRSLVNIGPNFIGFPPDELEVCISRELQNWSRETTSTPEGTYGPETPLALTSPSYRILDFGRNLTGFVGAQLTCTTSTRVFISFDELLRNDDVDFLRLGMVNAICLDLEPGTYAFESFEPYTLRHLKLSVVTGDCTFEDIHLREYANDDVWESQFACSEPELNRVWDAGVETFRQNSVDLFMDCPSRERAAWLCDSLFTARAARDLCSSTTVERNFLENYLLPESFKHLPKGMLPMCYPADHPDQVFIPNWALWLVVQLEEYSQRTGDQGMVEAFKPKVLALFDYFKPFRNSDGLLEKLPGWIFVEWSASSNFLQDVNYPTNMLYAGALAAAGRMYGMPALLENADRVRDTIRDQSFNGEFFVDNAMRKGDRLEVTSNTTEVCQYYAFYFDVATTSTHAQLWDKLREDFGIERDAARVFPQVHKANAFIGNALRMHLLAHFGAGQQMLIEAQSYFGSMAERTGTLWEMDGAVASCNHGFASHVCNLLMREALGIQQVDPVKKVITMRTPVTRLEWAQGRTRAGDGFLTVSWTKVDGSPKLQIEAPAGYEVVWANPQI